MKYKGEFQNGKMHGNGEYWKAGSNLNATGKLGVWENGVRVSSGGQAEQRILKSNMPDKLNSQVEQEPVKKKSSFWVD